MLFISLDSDDDDVHDEKAFANWSIFADGLLVYKHVYNKFKFVEQVVDEPQFPEL